jgi:hypothetical protein
MKRNVLYLKPRTVFILDTVVPSDRDVNITILFQTTFLKDIEAGTHVSTITKDGNKLFLYHLNPENMDIQSVQTPHYEQTMNLMKPLVKEGMLTVNARTNGNPVVIGNLLTTTTGSEPPVTISRGDGCVTGKSNGVPFAFTTMLNTLYETEGILTDALSVTWNESSLFAMLCTRLNRNGGLVLQSQEPLTFELLPDHIRYYVSKECEVIWGTQTKPSEVIVNGVKTRAFKYDSDHRTVTVKLPAGGGTVQFR